MTDKNCIKEGYYDFDKPSEHWRNAMTISGGLFQWTKTADGKSFKKKKCFVRVRAFGGQYDDLCKALQDLKDLCNDGTLSVHNFTTNTIFITYAQAMVRIA